MSIQFTLAFAVETKEGLVKQVNAALGQARAYDGANELARALLDELQSVVKQQAKVLKVARDYSERMEANLRKERPSEMSIMMATAHAVGPVKKLSANSAVGLRAA